MIAAMLDEVVTRFGTVVVDSLAEKWMVYLYRLK
jgi:hypothetical protein